MIKSIEPKPRSTHSIPVNGFENGSAKQAPFIIQPKLRVSGPGDSYEREADSVANRVMGVPGQGFLQHQNSSIQPAIQRMTNTGGDTVAGSLVQSIQSSRGRGHSLDSHTKSFMASRFGSDLSGVNIHTNKEAADMNAQLQAKAFTVGNDIYFNEAHYRPHTSEGKHLLAHEITHTLQQTSAGTAIQRDGDEPASGVDFDFDLLPPHLQLTLPHFLLDANTSRVRTQFSWNDIRTSLEYSYGESIDLGLRYRAFSTQLGFNPSSSVLSYGASLTLPSLSLSGTGSYSLPDRAATVGLSGSYRGVRLGGTYNFGTSSLGVNFGYGAPLLPTPDEMGSTFGAAGSAIPPLVSSLPGATADPMAWYRAQQERISAVTQGVEMFNRLREEPSAGIRFGVGGRVSYNPTTGLFVFVGVRGSF